MESIEPTVEDPAVFAAGIHQYVAVRLPSGERGLAKVIGWADNVGRPCRRCDARYVVVEGDYSAGDLWSSPLLLKLPAEAGC